MKKKLWGRYITYWALVIAMILMGIAICYGVGREPPTTTRAVFLVGIFTGLLFANAYYMAWSLLTPIVKYLWNRGKHKQYSFIEALGGKV